MGLKAWATGVVRAVVGEAVVPPITYEDRDDANYRSITSTGWEGEEVQTDFAITRTRRLARLNYFRNAVGGAAVDSLIAKCFGDGLDWKANEPEVKKVLDGFAADPDNDLHENAVLYALELLLLGELCLPIFVTPANADVRMGYMRPDRIEEVIWRTDDEKKAIAILQKRAGAVTGSSTRWLWIIPHPDPAYGNRYAPHPALTEAGEANTRPGRDGLPVKLPTYRVVNAQGEEEERVLPEIQALLGMDDVRVAGYAFYHRHGSLVTGRGRSIYERVNDWLKGFDDFGFGMLRNAILSAYVLFQVKVKGGEQAVKAARQQLKKLPPPGTLRITNEGEEWVDIKGNTGMAPGMEALGSMVLKVIGLGIGLAGHEVGAEQDVNRNTATETGNTVMFRAKRLQRKVSRMYGTWFDYVLAQKQHRKQLPETVTREAEDGSTFSETYDASYELLLPELDRRNAGQVAQAVTGAVTAMREAVEAELVLRADARAWVAQQMGLEPRPETEFAEMLAQQRKEDEARGVDTNGDLWDDLLTPPGGVDGSGTPGSRPTNPAGTRVRRAPVGTGSGLGGRG